MSEGIKEALRRLSDELYLLKSRLGITTHVEMINRSLLDYVELSGVSSPVRSDSPNELVRKWCGGGEGSDYVLSYIDSSSRSVGFDLVRIHVVAGASLVAGDLMYVPSIGGSNEVPFIAIKSVMEVLNHLERRLGGLVRVKDLVGNYYLPNYKDDDIGDELRVCVENYLLSRLVRREVNDAVVIDGPIYHLPTQALNSKYGALFIELVKARVGEVVRSEVPVIGFVKRVEYSRKLIKCPLIREYIRSRLGRELPPDTNDAVVADYILMSLNEVPMLNPVIIGPLKHTYVNLPNEVKNMPLNRIYWYVVRRSVAGSQVARIEVLEEHWRRWGDLIEEVINQLLSTLTLRNVPLGIDVVDRVSKRLSGSMYLVVANEVGRVLNLSYDEYDRVSEVSRELIGP